MTPEPPIGSALPPNVVVAGRYEILQRAGDGGVFTVFQARDRETGSVVALKAVKSTLVDDHAFVDRLESEARAAQALNDPHIVRILDVVRDTGTLCIITEFVAGVSLADRIQRTAPLPPAVAADIATDIAVALAAAQIRGMVHGDLRPGNVLIGGDGAVKVADFGVAQALGASPNLQVASVLRWVQCMAPEVGEGQTPTPASDVYSLGCILYQMLTGSPPFPGENALVVALKHVKELPKPADVVNPSVPRSLSLLTARCLEKEPRLRYLDAAAVLEDLHRIQQALRQSQILDSTPAQTLRPVPTEPISAPVEPRPAPVVETYEDDVPRFLVILRNFLLIVIGIGIVVGILFLYRLFQPVKDIMVPNVEGMTQDQALQTLSDKGLNGYTRQRESTHPAGEVMNQDPDAGLNVKPGRSITLYVSKGPRVSEVPGVTEMSVDRAREQAAQAGLVLKKVDEKHDEDITKGYVISQIPTPGEQVKPGTTIKVTVSLGPEPPPPPPPVVLPTPTPDMAPPLDPNAPPTTDANGAPLTPAQQTGRVRGFNIRFQIPTSGYEEPVEVQIVTVDQRGETIAVDEQHQLGEEVEKRVDAVGERVKLRVYLNGKLFSQESK